MISAREQERALTAVLLLQSGVPSELILESLGVVPIKKRRKERKKHSYFPLKGLIFHRKNG